jgi:hypothetical protein
LVRVSTPTVPSTPLPTKFAVAEKHIWPQLIFDDDNPLLPV